LDIIGTWGKMDVIAPESLCSEEEMRLRTISFLSGFVLIMLLAGCAPATISSPATSLPLPSALPAHTATPTFVPSPSPTSTSIPTAIPTAVPTLPVEVARPKLLEMLGNNSNCRLPCLWGITPGESTKQEAQAILSPLSSLSGFTAFSRPSSGAIDPVYTDGDLETYMNLSFAVSPENDIVTNIVFLGRALRKSNDKNSDILYYDVFDSKLFREHMRAYMLPYILSEQGIPTSVKLYTSGGMTPGGPIGGFHILLLYPDQGFLVHYNTQMKIVGANVRGCPASAYVELQLYPAGNGDSFIKSLSQSWQDIISDYYKPVETVTSMSQEQFYETFRQPTEKCIETPAKLWPTPEVPR
jgi:hypothetical protein